MPCFCRTCFKLIRSSTYIDTNQTSLGCKLSIKQQIQAYVPEMDVDKTTKAVVCEACSISLKFIEKFHEKCMQTEARILKHIQKLNSSTDWDVVSNVIAHEVESEQRSMNVYNENHTGIENEVQENVESENLHSVSNMMAEKIKLENETENCVQETGSYKKTVNSQEKGKGSDDKALFNCFVKLVRLPESVESSRVKESHKPIDSCVKSPFVMSFKRNKGNVKTEPEENISRDGFGNSNKQHNDKSYCCSVCNKDFTNAYDFKHHNSTHDSKKCFKCNICGKCFKQRWYLKLHKRRHTDDKAFKCSLCYKRFTTKASLDYHFKSHTGEKPYKCPACESCFKTNTCMKLHYMRIHNHSKQQSNDGNKPFKCNICGVGFKILSNLKRHMRTHTGEKKFECYICFKRYTTKDSLVYHLKSHTGEKPFKCLKCGARFKRKQCLAKHMRIRSHFFDREKCVEMPKSHCRPEFVFVSVTNTEQYPAREGETNTKTAEIETKNVSSDFLSKNASIDGQYGERSQLENLQVNLNDKEIADEPTTMNIKYISTEKLKARPRKSITCTSCGKAFANLSNLKRHMRTHTGETPFMCGTCNNRYTTKASLEYHIKSHTGEKPFICLKCGAQFKEKWGLARHMKTHGNNSNKTSSVEGGGKSSNLFVCIGTNSVQNDCETNNAIKFNEVIIKTELL